MKDGHQKKKPDPIDSVRMLMASERDCDDRYIRQLTATSDSFSISLYMNCQIEYLKKISAENPIIHVDTTYNLSNIFAMVTTLRATHFIEDPIIIGPILLTTRQRQYDFQVLWRNVIMEAPQLAQAKLTFVTDGDQALTNSIREMFPLAHLFRCSLHLRENVKKKASDCNVPPQLIKQISQDVNDMFSFHGFNFYESCRSVFEMWRNSAKIIHASAEMEKFITSYFERKPMHIIYENLHETIKEAGHAEMSLTNNCAESMNAMLKSWCGEKNAIDELCLKLKKGTLMLYEEIERGYIQLSQRYVLKGHYQPLSATEAMSQDIRQFDGPPMTTKERLVSQVSYV